MHEITSENAAEYLRRTGRAGLTELIQVRELPGGVSNLVLLVSLPASGQRLVLKQARERLRVKDDWRCPPERIWREVGVLRTCGELIQLRIADCGLRNEDACRAEVPGILWEDRENYAYAMTAAPEAHKTWKEMLLAEELDSGRQLAISCSKLLANLHSHSWKNDQISVAFADRSYFEQLRLDPYYRRIAQAHADLAPHIERLIDSVWQHSSCLVHGDFSPKNLLVWPGHVMLIDFEVGHFGDPAFDLGFFLTHLVLKSIWSGRRRDEYVKIADDFWTTYRLVLAPRVPGVEMGSLEQRMLWNLAGCLLARVDGKSPVDYLSTKEQQTVRDLARRWIKEPPLSWEQALHALQ